MLFSPFLIIPNYNITQYNMKKIIVLACISVLSLSAYAQMDIDEYSKVEITAQTQDWWSALKTHVPTDRSCSYNLWNMHLGRDVSFFIADGSLWTERGGWFGSDISLKRNIQPIESAMDKIMQLHGVRFQYKPLSEKEETEYDTIAGNGYRFGLLAQEVEQVLPEVVKTIPDGRKAISYTDLIAILIEAVKQQQTEINELRQVLRDNNLLEE